MQANSEEMQILKKIFTKNRTFQCPRRMNAPNIKLRPQENYFKCRKIASGKLPDSCWLLKVNNSE